MSNNIDTLKEMLILLLIMQYSDGSLPFKIIYDTSDFAIRAVITQRRDIKPYVPYYARKTLNDAQINYTVPRRNF